MLIPLTKGKFAIVDHEDSERVGVYKWHIFSQRGYAGRDTPRKDGRKKILMHRFITNAPDNLEVDHINGNVLDNRKCNLRLATHRQNCYNHPGFKKIKGVAYIRNRSLKKPYAANITVNYRRIHLGYFSTEEEAGKAYNEAAKKYFGEFARLN